MDMLVLLAHLLRPAKQYERQIVHCGNGLSGNAISTVSIKLQATIESAWQIMEGASLMSCLAFHAPTAD
jgi:hypothetical protein